MPRTTTARTTAPASTPEGDPGTTHGAPGTVRAATVLLGLLVPVHLLGLVLFGVVWADDPLGVGLVFAVVFLLAALTAVLCLPALLRGERAGWLVVTGWAVSFSYWSVYKVFGMPEPESLPFLAVGLAVCGLLLTPSARRHAGL